MESSEWRESGEGTEGGEFRGERGAEVEKGEGKEKVKSSEGREERRWRAARGKRSGAERGRGGECNPAHEWVPERPE